MVTLRRLPQLVALCLALLPALRCVQPDPGLTYLCDGSDGGGCPEGTVCRVVGGEELCIRPDAARPADAGKSGLDGGRTDAAEEVLDADTEPEIDAGPKPKPDAGATLDGGPTPDTGGVEPDGGAVPPDAGTCGVAGFPCCSPDDFCESGTVCSADECVPCGVEPQPCCAGGDRPCQADHVCSDSNVCQGCGQVGEPCCGSSASPCAPGSLCAGERCAVCGGAGQPCCGGGVCTGQDVACGSQGLCVACGLADEAPCCPPGAPGQTSAWCQPGRLCVSGACKSCGGDEQAPCNPGSQHFCAEGLEIDSDGVCRPCGEDGAPCCRGGSCDAPGSCCDAPLPGSGARLCYAGTTKCQVAGGVCTGGICAACGISSGSPCCTLRPDGGSEVLFCHGEMGCAKNGNCFACGGFGQPCCVGDLCTEPFTRCDVSNRACVRCGDPLSSVGSTDNGCCPGGQCKTGCCAVSACVVPGADCTVEGVCSESGQCTTCSGQLTGCCEAPDAGSFCLAEGKRCVGGGCL